MKEIAKKVKNKLLCFVFAASMVIGSAISAFAAEAGTVDPSSVLSESLNSTKGDIFKYIGIILPVALGIMGVFFGIKKAIAFFKSTAK